MKKKFTLIIVCFICSTAFALQPQTKFSISSFSNSTLRIIIDGNSYNYDRNRNDGDFVLNNLAPGRHSVKIYQQPQRRRNGAGSNTMRVIFDGNIFLRPQYYTDITINRFGKAFADEAVLNAYDDDSYPNQYPQYNQQMTAESFNALKNTISSESFDATKLTIAKQVATNNYFSTAQVKELLQLFQFENNKLGLAENLYSRTTDKGNYFMINDAFRFSSNKDALNEYIRQHP